jgi:hypothetical protein
VRSHVDRTIESVREDDHVLKIDKEHPSPDSFHHVTAQEEDDGADGQTAETDVGGRRNLETLLLQKVQALSGERVPERGTETPSA